MPEKNIFELYAENRKKFDDIRRQMLKLNQKEKEKYYKPTMREIINSPKIK